MALTTIDKCIFAKFTCPTCNNISYMKADTRGEFPLYMQCYHCEQYLAVFTNITSLKINVNAMCKEEVEWFRKIESRSKDSQHPLLIYRTRLNAL
jgi:hypothetical protein